MRYEERLNSLDSPLKEDLILIKAIEDETQNALKSFEEELRLLELKYDQILNDLIRKRNNLIQSSTLKNKEFWLRALSNHKVTKGLITESDKDALKHLKNVSCNKSEDKNVLRP